MAKEKAIHVVAPAFNDDQKAAIQRIESICVAEAVAFSCSRVFAREQPMPTQYADGIFHAITSGIVEATCVLGIVDNPGDAEVLARNPDAGTAWALGYAFALQVPVYLFTRQARTAKLDVMIALGSKGVIYGWEDLCEWISGIGKPEPWQGRIR